MKTKLFFAVSALFLLSLHLNAQSSAKTVSCELSKVTKSETIPLSSLIDDCTFVQLENSGKALFKLWFTTVTNKYIGIRQHGQGDGTFKLFDRTGKFLCNVGSKGQGPGEYQVLYDDIIDDKRNLIYLAPFSGKKILVYNTSGKFVKEIVAPQNLQKPRLHLSDDGTLSVVHMAFKGDKAIAFQFDTNGKLIKELAPPEELLGQSFDEEIFNSRNTREFDFQYTTNKDVLYHYSVKENKISPVFTLKTNPSEKVFAQYLEFNNRYIAQAFGKAVVSVDKKTNVSSKIKIVNDYYGNLEAPVNVMTFRGGFFIHNLEPGELVDLIEKRMKESNCTAQDKAKLKKLLSSIDKDANNVVFIGKLK
ncbi:MAG: 6-bladed beta-propeller [Dysgonamonadaceae bacterium]|jgi:hypothetical protein|nr:6-bladed beta-propeller [Dysgonamonadaceae bacterium]